MFPEPPSIGTGGVQPPPSVTSSPIPEGLPEVGQLVPLEESAPMIPPGDPLLDLSVHLLDGLEAVDPPSENEGDPSVETVDFNAFTPTAQALWLGLFGADLSYTSEKQILFSEILTQNEGRLGNTLLLGVLDDLPPGPILVSIGSHVPLELRDVRENWIEDARDQQMPPSFLDQAAQDPGHTYNIVLVDYAFEDGAMLVALQDYASEGWQQEEPQTGTTNHHQTFSRGTGIGDHARSGRGSRQCFRRTF